MPDGTMVERVARVLSVEGDGWCLEVSDQCAAALARAAIAAMREPTERMWAAGNAAEATGGTEWIAMVDAALGEPDWQHQLPDGRVLRGYRTP